MILSLWFLLYNQNVYSIDIMFFSYAIEPKLVFNHDFLGFCFNNKIRSHFQFVPRFEVFLVYVPLVWSLLPCQNKCHVFQEAMAMLVEVM